MMTNKQHDDGYLKVCFESLPGIHEELKINNDLLILKQLWESGTLTDKAYQATLLTLFKKRGHNVKQEHLNEEAKGLL